MLFLTSCHAAESVNALSESVSAPLPKTLIAVYMVGGNLEDDAKPRNGIPDEQEMEGPSLKGAGTDDLKEMVAAYQTLSSVQKEALDIHVAFGGARKAGWKGTKYADMACLVQDSQDQYFGNDHCYQQQIENNNMSSSESLAAFLKFLKPSLSQAERKALIFWDHGLSYLGVGQDSTAPSSDDFITLTEMKSAFSASGVHFDLMAFDACLMASLEVARVIYPYARYMLASEELEPGHGWYYTDVLTLFAQNAHLDMAALGKKLVDSYLDTPQHNRSKNKYKTLSLLDLEQVSPLIAALTGLTAQINFQKFEPLLQAVENSQHFGKEPQSDISYSIDLKDWLQNLKQKQPEASVAAEQALSRLQSLVVYARHDDSKPNANGVSIYSLNKNMKPQYGLEQAVSEPWLNFAGTFVSTGSHDQEKPVISTENFSLQQNAAKLCSYQGRQGHCLKIQDNLGIREAEQVFALKADSRYLFLIGSEVLHPLEQNSQYFAPVWNGEWLLLCDGNCQTGLSLFPPAYFEALTTQGHRIYSSEALLNDEKVVFYLEMDANNRVVSQWAIPYSVSQDGRVILSRTQLNIAAGDSLQFFYQVYDTQAQVLVWKKGSQLRFGQTPVWDFAQINASKAYFFQAQDYQGNTSLSPLYEVQTN